MKDGPDPQPLVFVASTPAPVSAKQAEPKTFTHGDFEYALLYDGTAKIIRYTGKEEALQVPGELDGHITRAIGGKAFFLRGSLTFIVVGRNSYEKQYCIDHGLPYTYPDLNDWLNP